jgi:hypothetical protein
VEYPELSNDICFLVYYVGQIYNLVIHVGLIIRYRWSSMSIITFRSGDTFLQLEINRVNLLIVCPANMKEMMKNITVDIVIFAFKFVASDSGLTALHTINFFM